MGVILFGKVEEEFTENALWIINEVFVDIQYLKFVEPMQRVISRNYKEPVMKIGHNCL